MRLFTNGGSAEREFPPLPVLPRKDGGISQFFKVPQHWDNRELIKRCRIPPAWGLGVSPPIFLKSPKTGGPRGLKTGLPNAL